MVAFLRRRFIIRRTLGLGMRSSMESDSCFKSSTPSCQECRDLGIVIDRAAGVDAATGAFPTLPCPACRLAVDSDGLQIILPHSIRVPW